MTSDENITQAYKLSLKVALITLLLRDPLLSPSYKIQLKETLSQLEPHSHELSKTIDITTLRKSFDNITSETIQELQSLLPVNYNYALSQEIEETVKGITRDLLYIGKFTYKATTSLEHTILKALKKSPES